MLRFIVLVRAGGWSGAMEWVFETSQQFLPTGREDGYDGSTRVVDHQSSQSLTESKIQTPEINKAWYPFWFLVFSCFLAWFFFIFTTMAQRVDEMIPVLTELMSG